MWNNSSGAYFKNKIYEIEIEADHMFRNSVAVCSSSFWNIYLFFAESKVVEYKMTGEAGCYLILRVVVSKKKTSKKTHIIAQETSRVWISLLFDRNGIETWKRSEFLISLSILRKRQFSLFSVSSVGFCYK